MMVMAAMLTGCSREDMSGVYQGYVEGKYVELAPAIAGTLLHMSVHEGQRVQRGDSIFSLESQREQDALQEASQRAAAVQARYEDLTKGKRQQEIDVISAQLQQAQADRQLAATQLRRARNLFAAHTAPQSDLDIAISNDHRSAARVQELQNQLAVARLPARADVITAARRDVDAAQAAVAQAQWALDQKSRAAPRDAWVEKVYHRVGEWVPAGAPVVSLLPDTNRIVRFFVPEPDLQQLKPGQAVKITCDSCPTNIGAHISSISTQAEFTPPVIYSRSRREDLVFMVEAQIDQAEKYTLHPGMPVEVSRDGG
jgi:HlyD family secretion protein